MLFYFNLKPFFLLKIFKLLVIEKNEFIAKLNLILKFMVSKICRIIIKIHVLLHISRIKSNQTMNLVSL